MSTQEKDVYLITGSSGLLGHALSHHFGSRDNTVVGFDQSGPPYPTPNTECLFCDLTSDESVQKTMFMLRAINGNKIKAVFHLAAYYSFSGKDSHLYKDLTIDGTRRLLRELQKFEVGQFIFSSSMLVYKPNQKGEKLTEESPVEPTWAYPQSKVDTEKVLMENRGNIPVVNLRIAGVYSDVCQSIPLAHQIQRIYEHRLEGHLYSGNVDVKQAFVHMDDLVVAFEDCVKNADKLSGFETINIGEEDALSYDETQRIIARELFDEAWPTLDVPKPIAKAGAWVEDKLPLPKEEKPFIKPWMIDRADDNYELSGEKARRLLGWTPRTTLRATLPKMLEGLKVDPKKWYKINKLHWNGDHSEHAEHAGLGEHAEPAGHSPHVGHAEHAEAAHAQGVVHQVQSSAPGSQPLLIEADPVRQMEHQTSASEMLDPPGPAPAAMITTNPPRDEQRSREAS